MYREEPDNELDSGWRFFSGEELPQYADIPANFSLHDVNTIANYDPDIIEFLDAPPEDLPDRLEPGRPEVALEALDLLRTVIPDQRGMRAAQGQKPC